MWGKYGLFKWFGVACAKRCVRGVRERWTLRFEGRLGTRGEGPCIHTEMSTYCLLDPEDDDIYIFFFFQSIFFPALLRYN